VKVDAFLCPAHVSAITGSAVYENFARNRETPCVIAGFEPLDILLGITGIIDQILQNSAFADNQYSRVVKRNGNLIAAKLISRYLEPVDACWRGLGIIKASGLKLKKEFSAFDSAVRYGITIQNSRDMPGCRCGDVLKGKITPRECSLFSTKCTPLNPAGPCMVSSEGACAAYYKYEMK
jgi:hydrogenase expression/formation protein HypD